MTGDATRALQYSLAIPVISHGPVESFKVSLLEKDSTITQFGNIGSEEFKSRCFQQALCNSEQKQ